MRSYTKNFVDSESRECPGVLEHPGPPDPFAFAIFACYQTNVNTKLFCANSLKDHNGELNYERIEKPKLKLKLTNLGNCLLYHTAITHLVSSFTFFLGKWMQKIQSSSLYKTTEVIKSRFILESNEIGVFSVQIVQSEDWELMLLCIGYDIQIALATYLELSRKTYLMALTFSLSSQEVGLSTSSC